MIMPFTHYVAARSATFDLTAGAEVSDEGYNTAASPLTGNAYGSVTDDTSPGGGTITAMAWQNSLTKHRLCVNPTGETLTNINIDGTDYALTFETSAGGNDVWQFSSGVQVLFNGNTYTCEVS